VESALPVKHARAFGVARLDAFFDTHFCFSRFR
jgi:hypothetical protein